MPVTHDIQILIDNQPCELGKVDELGLLLSYALEDPENFREKQSSTALGITLPATSTNDKIFNSFYDPKVRDMSGTDAFTNPRSCSIIVDGIEILTGKVILSDATHTRLPGEYTFDSYANNGDWIIDMQDLTIWDCLNTTPHTFDVPTVEASWLHFDDDEFHDYVYAPVRYRQPFGNNDDAMNIFHLRPSLSIYWLLVRAFRQFGYSINSQFLNTSNYFRRMVLPWVWGDFYDINSQLTDGVSFIAAGQQFPVPTVAEDTSEEVWTGVPTDPASTRWVIANDTVVGGGLTGYVENYTVAGPGYSNFLINDTLPPLGADNFSLYSFDPATGTMSWHFAPPTSLSTTYSINNTVNFQFDLIAVMAKTGTVGCSLTIECTQIPLSGPTVVTNILMDVFSDLGSDFVRLGSLLYPTVFNFSIPNVNLGDTLNFRLKYNVGYGSELIIISSGWLNTNPTALGVSSWQYDPTTERMVNIGPGTSAPVWQLQVSTFSMTGLEIAVGGQVHFQWYDKFRSYKFLDLLTGLCDLFDLSIQTDPILKMVTIEPTHDYVLPDGTKMPGYFKPQRLDWSAKQDISKESTVNLFSDNERQFDFSFMGDGSDGGQNIYAARYKAIYLNNKLINPVNNTNTENGITSAIPGASRYMFPERFKKGARQLTNNFFSATLHYKHTKWNNINQLLGGTPFTPQLIVIIPENINDSSASAITQTFEPKIAFYSGQQPQGAVGGWRWQGDPIGRGYDAAGIGIPTYNDPSDVIVNAAGTQPLSVSRSIGFELPYMFSVDYTGWVGTAPGTLAPVLSYSDQLINGVVKAGLMKTFFLKRLAKIRNGRQYVTYMRLGLGDVIDWEHRNSIIIDGAIYHLIVVTDYNPVSDDSASCTFWMAANPDATDVANCYPSPTSILTNPSSLPQFDLKYAPLLLFQTDLPQAG